MPACPLSGFAIYDDDLVTIETLTAEHMASSMDEVGVYVAVFDELRAERSYRPGAVALVGRVTGALTSDGLGV